MNRRYYIWLTCVLLLGLLCGIGFSIGSKPKEGDSLIVVFYSIDGCVRVGSVFIKRLMLALLLNAGFFLFGLNRYLVPACFVAVFVQGYLFGAAAVFLVAEFALSGVIVLCLVLIPQQLCFNFPVVIAGCYSWCCCIGCGRYGRCAPLGSCCRFYCITFCLQIVAIIFESLLIVVIVNPILF